MTETCVECGEAIPMDDLTLSACGKPMHFDCLSKHGDHCTDFMCQGTDDGSTAFLSEVITTAVEGGIQYWAEVAGYNFSFTSLGGARDWAEAHVRELGGLGLPDGEWKHITPNTLAPVFERLNHAVAGMNNFDRTMLLVAWQGRDSGDIDATLADQVFQVFFFGEVRYG